MMDLPKLLSGKREITIKVSEEVARYLVDALRHCAEASLNGSIYKKDLNLKYSKELQLLATVLTTSFKKETLIWLY